MEIEPKKAASSLEDALEIEGKVVHPANRYATNVKMLCNLNLGREAFLLKEKHRNHSLRRS